MNQGNIYPDPIHTAKVQGTHFRGTAKHIEITATPDSKTGCSYPDAPGWADMKPTTADNTYSKK